MTRKRTSTFEDIILVASRLPWWVCILLAMVSYIVLHVIASRPATPVSNLSQLGDAASRGMVTALATFGQVILPFAFGLAALLSGINSIRRRKLYDSVESRSDVAALNEMSWHDFERLVGEYYRRNDFLVTWESGSGPDGGIDLVLRKRKEMYLVQCKQWRAYKVGVQPVREFYGVMAARGADGGYFVTSGTYTGGARTFARGLNIELIDGQKLRRMIDAASKKPAILATPIDSQQMVIAPLCPKCGAEMRKRMAGQGKHIGEEFWGCANFPKCTGILLLEENRRKREDQVLQ
jgi:restriction system protein